MPAFPYLQDVIAPVSVHDCLDFGDPDPAHAGMFGHWYHYLDYHFAEDGETLSARHYRDEPGRVLIAKPSTTSPFVLRVLVFLLMRYEHIMWLEAEGYVPVPADIMAEARTMRDAHLAGPWT